MRTIRRHKQCSMSCQVVPVYEETIKLVQRREFMHLHKSIPLLAQKWSHDFDNIHSCSTMNKMCSNVNKTKCMLIVTKHKRVPLLQLNLNINLHDSALENVSSIKLLGVTVQNVSLIDNQEVLPLSVRKQFYSCFVLPYFDYCTTIWGNCFKKDKTIVKMVEKLQAPHFRLRRKFNISKHVLKIYDGIIYLVDTNIT